MTQKTQKKQHHHGNLREALVDAGLEILAEKGLSGLTLRACAARAGVSHAAPAHHFAGRDGLIAAIKARGYRLFTAAMLEQKAAAPADPREQLLAICDGYMRFADGHPALFALMFNTGADLIADEAFDEAAGAAYGVLHDCCAPFEPVSDDPESTEAMVWSLVHGLTCLLQGGRMARAACARPTIRDVMPPLTLRRDA